MGDNESVFKRSVMFISKYKKMLAIVLVPLFASIIPITIQTPASYCAFVVILMSVYWIIEALPIGLTSLIPLVLFPAFGILPADKVAIGYFKDFVILFFGGLVMAKAIEMTRLHERMALKVLLVFGSQPKWLMLGFMLITSTISLFMCNTATTSMMLPIYDSVVKELIKNDATFHELEDNDESEKSTANGSLSIEIDNLNGISDNDTKKPKETKANKNAENLAAGFMLACAYSATIGGIGTIVGNASNVFLKGYFDKNYPQYHLNFLTFTLFALPIAIVMLFISWLWLCFTWLPKETFIKRNAVDSDCHERNSLQLLINEKYKNLGSASWAQVCTGCIFVLLVVLWLTRDLHAVNGWEVLFKKDYISDATPAIFAVFLLFICPKENIFAGKPYEHLINWRHLQQSFPWSIMLLLGGGLVMADGFKSSGLSNWIGSQLNYVALGSRVFFLLIITIISAVATEFTSNASIASIFIPIVDAIAQKNSINPPYVLLPVILSVSFAFMLPIAAPNNSVIFSTGYLKIRDMVKTGLFMNILGLVVTFIAANTYLELIFKAPIPGVVTNTTRIYNMTNPFV